MAVKAVLRRMTILDRGIVLLLLLATVASFALLKKTAPGERLVVEQNGRVIYTAPLQGERQIRLPGPLGETELVIHHGRACIVSSPCPLKVCIGMGEVARSGQVLACVPNQLLVRIEGAPAKDQEYDLLSR